MVSQIEKTAASQLINPTINDLDQLLEKLLLKELPLKKNGIDISFDQPNREWSSQLNGPTLNLFLCDVRKNKLRQAQWETRYNGKNKVTQHRAPLRLDLQYLVTAWVIDGNPDEEHYLLTAALLALSRHPRLPDPDFSPTSKDPLPAGFHINLDFLPKGLQNQPGPIALLAAEPEELLNPVDIWNALDNELRPSIICKVTLAFDPFQPVELDMVRTREIRTRPMPGSIPQRDDDESPVDLWPPSGSTLYRLAGVIHSAEPLENMRLLLLGRKLPTGGLFTPILSMADKRIAYRFAVNQLRPGDYTLEASARALSPLPFDISIPFDVSSPSENETLPDKLLLGLRVLEVEENKQKFYRIEGTISTAIPPAEIHLTLGERDDPDSRGELSLTTDAGSLAYSFKSDPLAADVYVLEISIRNWQAIPYDIVAPAAQTGVEEILVTVKKELLLITQLDLEENG